MALHAVLTLLLQAARRSLPRPRSGDDWPWCTRGRAGSHSLCSSLHSAGGPACPAAAATGVSMHVCTARPGRQRCAGVCGGPAGNAEPGVPRCVSAGASYIVTLHCCHLRVLVINLHARYSTLAPPPARPANTICVTGAAVDRAASCCTCLHKLSEAASARPSTLVVDISMLFCQCPGLDATAKARHALSLLERLRSALASLSASATALLQPTANSLAGMARSTVVVFDAWMGFGF